MSNPVLFGVRNFKMYPILTDPETDAAMTFGAALEVPGINEATLTLESEEVIARGDDADLEVFASAKSVSVGVKFGDIPMEAMALMMGGTYTCSAGSDTITYNGTELPDYVKIEFVTTSADGRDFKVVVNKAKATTSIEQSFADKQVAEPTTTFRGALPRAQRLANPASATPMLEITLDKS